MEISFDVLLKEIHQFMEAQLSLSNTIKKLIEVDEKEETLSNKLHKNLNRLNYYLDGCNDLTEDTLKSIDKFIEKKKNSKE